MKNEIQTTTHQELATHTWSKFIKIYQPGVAVKVFKNVTTIKKAIEMNGKTPSVGGMLRTYGEASTEAYIKLWLVNLNTSLGLKRPLNEAQMDETAMVIVEDFKNLNLSDINLVFRGMKTGEYGEYYESINMAKIISIFKEYFNNRMQAAASMSLEKHLSGKQEGERSDDRIQKRIDASEKAYKNEKHQKDLKEMKTKYEDK